MHEGQLASPSQEPTLEVAWNNSLSLRDTLAACHTLLSQIEEFAEGPRPEVADNAAVDGAGGPPGMVARLCLITNASHDELLHLQKRVVGIANRLGVQL